MKFNYFTLIAMTTLLLIIGACSEDSTTNPTTTSLEIDLFAAAKQVAPSFDEVPSTKNEKDEWEPDDPMAYLFNTFRMFDPEIHQGVIDGSNFFRALFDMDENLQYMLEITDEIDPVVIEEPFELGNSITYDHAINTTEDDGGGNLYKTGYAYRVDGDTVHFLVTYQVTENDGAQITMGQLQGSYDTIGGDIDLAMVYLVDYAGDSYYVVRNEITGNKVTHAFELRMTISGNGGYGTTIAGKGISQGDGAYFLIKMNYGDGMTGHGERYYVFPSDADEAFLHDIDRAGLQYDALPPEVADYQAAVRDKALFTTGDLPVGHVDFNNSDITLEF